MKLNKLSLNDKGLFAGYLNLSRHELSVYAFENIYGWRGLFDIRWALIGGGLCVFFKDKIGCFMYFSAQGRDIGADVVKEVFGIMDGFNKNKDISRIENIEEKEFAFYRDLGYQCLPKYPEYLCNRVDLAQLKGNRFKSKRACSNYFVKNYRFQYLPLQLADREDCFRLFEEWQQRRLADKQDSLYRWMLEDSGSALETLLDGYADLDLTGRVVKIGGRVAAFTFGFKLNCDTFCILYEVTDLGVKGLAQFIFRRFCAELKDCEYINIMDDSGLENIRKAKLSYRPVRLIPAYIAKRKNG